MVMDGLWGAVTKGDILQRCVIQKVAHGDALVLVPVADLTRVTLIILTSSPMSQDLAGAQG